MIYLQLFLSFLQIGLFSFGGGYAAMPLIQDQVVTRYGWLSMAEFTDLITISQMTPGPIAVNSATFVGYRVCGFTGALCATLGVVLPSFLVITAIAFVLREFQSMKVVQYAFFGIRAGVLALILKALWSMYRQCPKNPISYAIAAGSFILAAILNVNVLLVLILCAAAGFLASTISLMRAES